MTKYCQCEFPEIMTVEGGVDICLVRKGEIEKSDTINNEPDLIGSEEKEGGEY